MSAGDPRDRAARNPFHVLGVRADAARAEVEREGQRLLDALALGLAGADAFATPFGPGQRTAEDVREALAELRDPERRALHEVFAAAPAPSPAGPEEPAPWPEALAALGWGRR
ncbi:MAG TPA: hypothetical protein VLT47_13610 [Anaeromyxobacteraceae bacterium]|nr:hypothetical protein [Anaeromyxobacteraceae bacterium]